MNTAEKGMLTTDDLMARWHVSADTIIKLIDTQDLPYVNLGANRGPGRKRPTYRFRMAAIERWEAEREEVRTRPAEAPAIPSGKPAGYSGKIHTKAGSGA